MIRLLNTCLVLAVFWLALSGKTDLLFLWFGLISVLITAVLAEHLWPPMVGNLSSPFRIGAFARYCLWLAGEIVKSNVVVIRAVLRAEPELSPSLAKYHATVDTALGRAILANSITVTPGTLVVEMTGTSTLVHALLESMEDADSFDDMDAKAARITAPEPKP